MFATEYSDDAITWGHSGKWQEVNIFEERGWDSLLWRAICHVTDLEFYAIYRREEIMGCIWVEERHD